jgi:hypothetical protein
MKLKTVKEEWTNFRRQVLPEGMPPDQEAFFRLTFFAGCLKILTDDFKAAQAIKAKETTPEEVGPLLRGLFRECVAFMEFFGVDNLEDKTDDSDIVFRLPDPEKN